nr:hypothetical protein [uncultured Pseudomonas sp.]
MKLADIGNTPFLELAILSSNGNKYFSTCEFLNPSGSHKDRTYLDQSSSFLNKEAWGSCGNKIATALKAMNVVPDFCG